MSAFHTAQFYELLGNRGGRLEREGSFLLEALASAPLKSVADLACGLGIHALFFAEHGATVTATDLSPEMIQHASATRPHTNITYAVADMRTPSGGPYGLVVCLGNSLCLLQQDNDLQDFFDGVSKVLAPGGLLITQTLNYESAEMKRPRIRTENAVTETGDVAAVKRFLPTKDATMLAITYYAATSGSLTEITETVHLRHWSADRLTQCATASGMMIDGLYGSFAKDAYTAGSPDIILVTQKG
jgi:2-polyprenyl-3-methyl-5-hydroxy-6-metoxy-1,4-benzoquinol methylase